MTLPLPACFPARSVINRAAAQLAPFLGGLKRQLHSGTGAPFSLEKQLLLQTMACDAMAACLLLAPHCRASDEARLQLARAAIGCLVGSWRWLLDAAKARLAQDLGNLPESLGNVFQNLLGSQLELAELALGAPGFSAVIAAETAPPAELAAWLAAVVDLSKWPWPGGRAGGCTDLPLARIPCMWAMGAAFTLRAWLLRT